MKATVTTGRRHRTDPACVGASLVKLVVLVLVAPVATFVVVSAVALFFRSLSGEAKPETDAGPRGPAVPSWQERLAHLPTKAPANQPPPRKSSPDSPAATNASAAPVAPPEASLGVEPTRVGPETAQPGQSVAPPAAPPVAGRPTAPRPAPAAGETPHEPVRSPPSPSSPASPASAPSASPPAVRAPVRPVRPLPRSGEYKATEPVWVIDDFEGGDVGHWSVKPWANAAELSVEEGALKIDLGPGKHDKSAIGCPFRMDLSSRKKVLVDVRNETGRRVGIALALLTGDASTYFETESRTVNPGVTKDLSFDLESSRFKCAASSWQHEAKLADPESVKSLCLLVYGQGKGQVFLDNLRCTSGEAP